MELGHGFLAEDELHDMESLATLAAEHRTDGARMDVLLVAADELRGALLQHQGLEDVEVLRDAREGVGHLAKRAAAGRAGVVLTAHAVVVPRQHLLLQPGEVRRLLLRGEHHGDGQRGIARRVRFDARAGAAVEVCGGGGERNGCAVGARPDDPRRAIVRRVQKPPNETRRVAVAPTLAPRVSAQPEGTSRDQIRASSNKHVPCGKSEKVRRGNDSARYSEGLKIDLKAVN